MIQDSRRRQDFILVGGLTVQVLTKLTRDLTSMWRERFMSFTSAQSVFLC